MRVNSYITGFGFLIITVIVVGIIISFMADTYSSVEVGEQRQETLLSRSGTSLQNYASSGSATRLNQTWLDFDGSDDEIDVDDSSSLNITNDEISFSLWIKLNSTGAQRILDKTDSYYLTVPSGATRVDMGLTGLSDSLMTGGGMDISDLEWHYVVMLYNSSHMVSYLDGTQTDIEASTGSITFSTNNLLIATTGASAFLNGSIDDLVIYNRSLTPSEIEIIYESGRGTYK